MDRNIRILIAAGVVVLLVVAVTIAAVAYTLARSNITRPFDNMFGDQHLKTAVALVELHKTRNGTYPRSLADLRFTGQWDQLALQSVTYCASDNGEAYYLEVTRGWVGQPALELPPEFWQGTGFRPDVGPCR